MDDKKFVLFVIATLFVIVVVEFGIVNAQFVCPKGSTCLDRKGCERLGGICVASCPGGCCCQILPPEIRENVLANLYPIFFIIGFLIFLLLLGTGLPRFQGINWLSILAKVLFLLMVVVLFILPGFLPYPTYLEVPESFKVKKLPSGLVSFFTLLGLPDEWMYIPAILYLFILPFAAIYTLIWAFLVELKIFMTNPKVPRVLAFIISFLTIPIGWFVKMVWIIFSFLGAYSLAIFAAMFIGGLFLRGFGLMGREYTMYQAASLAAQFRDWANRRLATELPTVRQMGYHVMNDVLNQIMAGAIRDLRTAQNIFEQQFQQVRQAAAAQGRS